MFAVVVTLKVKPANREAFLPLMQENAAASLRDEPGCRQFDICTDPEQPETVLLYEIYDSPDAFQAHLETPHFKAFDNWTASMLVKKTVATFREVRQ